MASLVGIIPPICSCDVNIGRLQANYEKLVETMSYKDAIIQVFDGYEPKMCCRIQFLNPLRYIPDDTFDKRVSEGDKFIYEPSYKAKNSF